jgi:hypothetical protein
MIRYFGTTIRETVNAFQGTHLGTKRVFALAFLRAKLGRFEPT